MRALVLKFPEGFQGEELHEEFQGEVKPVEKDYYDQSNAIKHSGELNWTLRLSLVRLEACLSEARTSEALILFHSNSIRCQNYNCTGPWNQQLEPNWIY